MPRLDADRANLKIEDALLAIAALAWQEDEPHAEATSDWGRFEGDLLVKFLDDGRLCELVDDYVYFRPDGTEWPVPAGAQVDGASIPSPFWPLIGGPFEGKYRNASVIHDFYCDNEERPWRDTHRMFYEAMRRKDVGAAKAKVMYYAVYRFGPRWPAAARPSTESAAATLVDQEAMSLLADAEAIYVHNLSIKEIERLADSRNASSMVSDNSATFEGQVADRTTRARSLVICGGSGTQEDLDAVAKEAENLSESIVRHFEHARIRIVACRDSVTDFETDLQGVIPRGWEQTGKTWDSVPGTYFHDRRRVVIATIDGAGARTVPTKASGRHGSESLVVHECLHGYDYSGNHAVLKEPHFQAARQADLPNLGRALNGYLVQAGQAGLEETFAESGARFALDNAAMAADWPNLHGYWAAGRTAGPELAEPGAMTEAMATADDDSIGFATLRADGSIDLDLRAEGPGGAIGHASMTISIGDKAHGPLRERLFGGRTGLEGAGDMRVPYVIPNKG